MSERRLQAAATVMGLLLVVGFLVVQRRTRDSLSVESPHLIGPSHDPSDQRPQNGVQIAFHLPEQEGSEPWTADLVDARGRRHSMVMSSPGILFVPLGGVQIEHPHLRIFRGKALNRDVALKMPRLPSPLPLVPDSPPRLLAAFRPRSDPLADGQLEISAPAIAKDEIWTVNVVGTDKEPETDFTVNLQKGYPFARLAVAGGERIGLIKATVVRSRQTLVHQMLDLPGLSLEKIGGEPAVVATRIVELVKVNGFSDRRSLAPSLILPRQRTLSPKSAAPSERPAARVEFSGYFSFGLSVPSSGLSNNRRETLGVRLVSPKLESLGLRRLELGKSATFATAKTLPPIPYGPIKLRVLVTYIQNLEAERFTTVFHVTPGAPLPSTPPTTLTALR